MFHCGRMAYSFLMSWQSIEYSNRFCQSVTFSPIIEVPVIHGDYSTIRDFSFFGALKYAHVNNNFSPIIFPSFSLNGRHASRIYFRFSLFFFFLDKHFSPFNSTLCTQIFCFWNISPFNKFFSFQHNIIYKHTSNGIIENRFFQRAFMCRENEENIVPLSSLSLFVITFI